VGIEPTTPSLRKMKTCSNPLIYQAFSPVGKDALLPIVDQIFAKIRFFCPAFDPLSALFRIRNKQDYAEKNTMPKKSHLPSEKANIISAFSA